MTWAMGIFFDDIIFCFYVWLEKIYFEIVPAAGELVFTRRAGRSFLKIKCSGNVDYEPVALFCVARPAFMP
jgi:hypothetical protein